MYDPGPHSRVMHLLATYDVGGAECVALNLCGALKDRFALSACALFEQGEIRARFDALGIETSAITPGAPRRVGRLGVVRKLARALRQHQVDILHCHNKAAQMLGLPAAWLARVPVTIFTRHGTGVPDRSDDASWLERRLTRMATHHIAVCRAALDAGVRAGRIYAPRATVIYNGIDTARYIPRPEDAPPRTGPTVIGCVARLQYFKGHSVLLKAVKRLAEQGLDFTVRLIGEGPERPNLEEETRALGIGRFVRFMGTQNNVPELLREMDVFVLPSLTEGLPLTAVEAMAAGLPVVATRVGGVPEVVRHEETGLLAPSNAPEPLADALADLLAAPDRRRRMGRRGREVAVQDFDLKVMAQRHADLYLKLLGKKSE